MKASNLKNLGPKVFQKISTKLNQKWQASLENSKEGRQNETNKRAFE
jgi:hypothetical protein